MQPSMEAAEALRRAQVQTSMEVAEALRRAQAQTSMELRQPQALRSPSGLRQQRELPHWRN
jgi:hypothetical protein